MKGLFGDVPEQTTRAKKDLAHPAPPGTGPEGETCGTCLYDLRSHYHDKHYHKCELMRPLWSHGKGTDIRMKDAACKFWRKDTN